MNDAQCDESFFELVWCVQHPYGQVNTFHHLNRMFFQQFVIITQFLIFERKQLFEIWCDFKQPSVVTENIYSNVKIQYVLVNLMRVAGSIFMVQPIV